MPDNKFDEFGKKVSDFIEFIPRYFHTLLSILIHPQKTFNTLLLKKNDSSFTKPATFLGANIILSILLAKGLGYSYRDFPFQPAWFDNYSWSDLFFVSIRLLLGILLFLFLIKLLIGYKKRDDFRDKAFPIICYSSSLYFIDVISTKLSDWFLYNHLLNIFYKYIMLPDKYPFYKYFINYMSYLIITIVILLWWCFLIYYGLKLLKFNSPRRTKIALISGLIIFFFISAITQTIHFFYINAATLRSNVTIITCNLDEEISNGPSSWLDSSLNANIVINNKTIPTAYRYAFLIKQITFMISLPKFNNDKKLVSEIMSKLKERKYEDIENIISKNKNIISGLDIEYYLNKARSFRKAPDYFVLPHKKFFAVPDFIIKGESNNSEFIIESGVYYYRIPLITPGKFISLVL
jgi:hypothetical protein